MPASTWRPVALLCLLILVASSCYDLNNRGPVAPLAIKGVMWSPTPLTWDQFVEVDSLEDGYDANIYSNIIAPKRYHKHNSLVYAYMDPTQSERVRDTSPSTQLLKHEQYHFNITEYYARLFRRELINSGKGNINASTIKHWYDLLEYERNNDQGKYDNESEHNTIMAKQRYWELKIDDDLREVAYYQNPDLKTYYSVEPQQTNFYRQIYYTLNQEILTTYPELEDNFHLGNVYRIEKNDTMTAVSFYKNGILHNGGYFNTAIIRIVQKEDDLTEVQHLDAHGNFNNQLERCLLRIITEENGDKTFRYYNAQRKPATYNGVHKKQYTIGTDKNQWYGSYFNMQNEPVANDDLAHHEIRTMDHKGRTISYESLDANRQPMLDKDGAATYNFSYDKNNLIVQYKLYDTEGNFATHLNKYNVKLRYDERGNKQKSENLNTEGKRAENKDGICIYKYNYDLYDNQTSSRIYNRFNNPTTGYNDYHQQVKDYDSLGRIIFKANYYPTYALAFSQKRDGASRYEYLNDSTQFVYKEDVYGYVFPNDDGISIVRNIFDDEKRILEERFLNENKEPVLNAEGVAMFRYEYDEKGNTVYQASFDKEDHLAPFNEDVAIIRWEYDEHGNKLKTSYFNKNNALANAAQNVTFNTYTYNDKQQSIGRAYFDKNMQPTLLDGVHRKEFFPNAFGNDTLVKEYGIDNQLIAKVAITRISYNEFGIKTGEAYFDRFDQRTVNADGIGMIRYLFDQLLRYRGYQYLDTQLQPTNDTSGIYSEIRDLSPAGYIIRYTYFDKDNKPVLGTDGYHKLQYTLDDHDFVTEESTYGVDGELIVNSRGIAKYNYTRAPSLLASGVKLFNAKDRPIENDEGVFEIQYTSSMNGLYYVEKEFNAMGKRVNVTAEELAMEMEEESTSETEE